MPDLSWWLSNFQHSAFRLETLPVYSVPQEVEMLAAFKRGEDVRLPEDHPWLERVRQHTRSGKLMRRVRIISHPLSDYLRFELSLYPRCVDAGEDIRIAEFNEGTERAICNQDLWLFDETTALMMSYDSEGHFMGTKSGSVDYCLQQRDIALSRATPLLEYTARTARP
jgi:hypothetical protein